MCGCPDTLSEASVEQEEIEPDHHQQGGNQHNRLGYRQHDIPELPEAREHGICYPWIGRVHQLHCAGHRNTKAIGDKQGDQNGPFDDAVDEDILDDIADDEHGRQDHKQGNERLPLILFVEHPG